MTSVIDLGGEHKMVDSLQNPSLPSQGTDSSSVEIDCRCKVESDEGGSGSYGGLCAICLDKIELEETAVVKGCEHAYCVTCILRWASYVKQPTCPQCKHPFDFLNVHRMLDGSIHDFMFEESVCLLLRARWFKPLEVEEGTDGHDDLEEYPYPVEYEYEYEDLDDALDEGYLSISSSIRFGNRRWGDNGYVRAGRQEARPASRLSNPQNSPSGSSSREPKKKEVATSSSGRRAKRTLKREAADKASAAAAAAKHEKLLVRLGRK